MFVNVQMYVYLLCSYVEMQVNSFFGKLQHLCSNTTLIILHFFLYWQLSYLDFDKATMGTLYLQLQTFQSMLI